jgi:23S rRNA (guanine2445-N2)-methyltransferase / 23S rRNA (guanine2069-N7)-methyltransferase
MQPWGGGKSSLSIDMSNGYIGWAGRNFHLNNMDAVDHTLLRADCLEWLAEVSDRTSDKASNSADSEYDLIFLDPPTFSNSKKMESVLDIQRDHPDLIQQAMAILAPGGTLVFSNNFRKFTMAKSVEQSYQVTNITNKTLDPDFQRNQKIHNCWLIQHKD